MSIRGVIAWNCLGVLVRCTNCPSVEGEDIQWPTIRLVYVCRCEREAPLRVETCVFSKGVIFFE